MIIFISIDHMVVDAIALEARLKELCRSVYKNCANQFFVNYDGDCKALYDNIFTIAGNKNILLLNITNNYWGYQNRELWSWLIANFQNTL